MDDNDAFRWCPSPDCEYAVECHIPSVSLISTIPTVECGQGHKFCFGCSLSDHQVKNNIESRVHKSLTFSY